MTYLRKRKIDWRTQTTLNANLKIKRNLKWIKTDGTLTKNIKNLE